MTCSFLKGTFIPVCTVYGDNYLPSNFELEKYCQSGKAGMCPYPTLRLYGIGHTNKRGERRNLPKEAAWGGNIYGIYLRFDWSNELMCMLPR